MALAGLYVLVLYIICKILHFNGLYGQDAHEYQRIALGYWHKMRGDGYVPQSIGDRDFAPGYPLLVALGRWIGLNGQAISLLASGGALVFLYRLIGVFNFGTRPESRSVFLIICLALSPLWIRSSVSATSEAAALCFFAGSLWCAARYDRKPAALDLAGFVGFGCAAILARYAFGVALLPVGLWVLYRAFQHKAWGGIVAVATMPFLFFLLHQWLKGSAGNPLVAHVLTSSWSIKNLFTRHFSNENGFIDFWVPNGVYIFFPFLHYAFFLPLSALFPLFRRTDVYLPRQKVFLFSAVLYALFIGVMPTQTIRYLLPEYLLLLVLFFPAWDRFFCYGFYFKPRWTYWILAAAVALQLACTCFLMRHPVQRQRLESALAAQVKKALPDQSVDIYAFDVDIALRSYLPQAHFFSLWETVYPEIPSGSYFIFNEPLLREQWAGKNPMLNWEKWRDRLVPVAALSGGWQLYRVP